ncbi:MAG: META domain-containing protein [Bacteroidales bacterium]|nr:META domain-containing protein [Bacteroidales bacterium]MCR5193168.1 META domain-containing protein [Bacteroidales bacterium]
MKYKTKTLVLIIIAIAAISMGACKCHKKVAVIEAKPEFNAEETWMLVSMRGKEVVYNEGQKQITLVINPEAGTMNGHSGCNRYFGDFKDLGDGQFELGMINATKMACPEPFHKIEGAYMQLLRLCDNYTLGEYTLELKQKDKVLLLFEKQQDDMSK